MKPIHYAVVALLALVVALAFVFRGGEKPPEPPEKKSPGFAVPGPEKTVPPETDDPVLSAWRKGIVNRHAEEVKACHRAFLSHREKYHPKLVKMARTDPEGRVRSFTTKVLGRMALPGDLELFAELLASDPSEYVRENAAWALGQLNLAGVREPLEKAAKGDSVEKVRETAAASLKALPK